MKNIYLILLSAGLLIASCGPTHTVVQSDSYQPAPAPVQDVSYQSFYDQLSPYGNWVNYPGYGYVWLPNAGPDFRPYATNGNWIYTDAGWTWASNYNWGWAPFHYGRWFFENGYGWIWVPGNEWAPAWVSWRGGNDYYGWAPMGPGISANMAMSNYNPPMNYWNFVPRRYMGNPGGHNYYVNQSQNVTIINNTTIINNYSGTNRNRYAYAPGPDPAEVRRVSGNNFTPVQIREASQPGERISGNQYMIYHPRVSSTTAPRGDAAGRPSTPAPARYESFNNMRPSAQYRTNTTPANNQPAVNPAQSTGYTQPNMNPQPVNPRPATLPPVSNPPANNQPVNTRPATMPPVSNPPANNQPVNTRPATLPPVSNPPANSQPVNTRPATQPPVSSGQPAPNMQSANRNPNEVRSNRYNRTQANANPQLNPVVQPASANTQNTGRTTTANTQSTGRTTTATTQTTSRTASNRNPNNGRAVQRTPKPDDKPDPKPTNKPDQKPTEKPKTREANDN